MNGTNIFSTGELSEGGQYLAELEYSEGKFSIALDGTWIKKVAKTISGSYKIAIGSNRSHGNPTIGEIQNIYLDINGEVRALRLGS